MLTEREEKAGVASNESFGGWTKTFTEPRLCATTIETGTDSYRLAQTRARQAAEHA
ncbi:hypothetical protein [Actinoallomurus acaciae]|uniref:Uncharacterized protein n=1 Tax=Actinoallomurus acaciae TaxID=502577 RepID=A0ABV5Y6T9_9ACTN